MSTRTPITIVRVDLSPDRQSVTVTLSTGRTVHLTVEDILDADHRASWAGQLDELNLADQERDELVCLMAEAVTAAAERSV